MKVLIAGEPSGDLQAASLIGALHQANPKVIQAGWGGSQMTAAGMQQKFDLQDSLYGICGSCFKSQNHS